MSDEELLQITAEARRAAHEAPMAMFCTENRDGKPTGHFFLENMTSGWADRSNEWMRLAEEVDRRGLKQPAPPPEVKSAVTMPPKPVASGAEKQP